MEIRKQEIRLDGETLFVDALEVAKTTIVVGGRFVRRASVLHEWNVDVDRPDILIEELKESGLRADIFTFIQRLPDAEPRYGYYMEWDNLAAVPLISYEHWWEKQITQDARNKVRKAQKKGLEVRVVEFDDNLIRGISEIYNETPVRQDKRFWHYGKDLATLKEIHATFPDQSTFLGAFMEDELVGFVKLVNAGRFVRTMHVLSKIKHRDKAPTNALIAKAVELCCERHIPYLVYGQYEYGNTGGGGLIEFKRHNGFQKILFPRYFVPLNLMGQIVLRLNLHGGIVKFLPPHLIRLLLAIRKRWYASSRRT